MTDSGTRIGSIAPDGVWIAVYQAGWIWEGNDWPPGAAERGGTGVVGCRETASVGCRGKHTERDGTGVLSACIPVGQEGLELYAALARATTSDISIGFWTTR